MASPLRLWNTWALLILIDTDCSSGRDGSLGSSYNCGYDGWSYGYYCHKPTVAYQNPFHGQCRRAGERVFTRLTQRKLPTQAQATSADVTERYTNTWIAFRSIYKTEGWRAFYRGLAPSLIGVTHVAVHFPLYEKMKAWAGKCIGCLLGRTDR